jgi:molybdenum-dependent DNA-binding transcriptional regulator ModE
VKKPANLTERQRQLLHEFDQEEQRQQEQQQQSQQQQQQRATAGK